MYKKNFVHIGDGYKGGYACKGIESGQHVRKMVMNVVENDDVKRSRGQ